MLEKRAARRRTVAKIAIAGALIIAPTALVTAPAFADPGPSAPNHHDQDHDQRGPAPQQPGPAPQPAPSPLPPTGSGS